MQGPNSEQAAKCWQPGGNGGSSGLLLLARSDHHHHLAAFKAGHRFDDSDLVNIRPDPLKQTHAELLMGHFAATKAQRDLDLVAFFQKAFHVAQLDGVVTIIGLRTKLDFLDLDDFLLGLGFGSAFLFLITELAIVHQPADRWCGIGGDFDQIDVGLFGHPPGLTQAEDAKLLVVLAQKPDFRGADFTVQTVGAFSSDACILRFNL